MKTTAISGIGCVTAAGNSAQEVWDALICGPGERFCSDREAGSQNEGARYGCAYPFPNPVEQRHARKCDRHILMSMYAVDAAQKNAVPSVFDGVSPDRIGTIFSTTHGSLPTNLSFAGQMLRGDADSCSPMLFTNTVANASLGQICIRNGYQGVSTMMLGSDSLGFARMLIHEGKADLIFSGCVEEYEASLFSALNEMPSLQGVDKAECAVVFLLSPSSEESRDTRMCSILAGSTAHLGVNPYIGNDMDSADVLARVEMCLRSVLRKAELTAVDYVFASGSRLDCEKIEESALVGRLPGARRITGVKHVLGETFGGSFSVNLMTAALCLQNRRIPASISGRGDMRLRDSDRVMVTGFGMSGNYFTAILEP